MANDEEKKLLDEESLRAIRDWAKASFAGQAQKITYSALKSLRDSGELIPGQAYRIIDYECTTSQEHTRSAGHQFDIIVVADDVNVLNENATAALHEDDEYFASSKLEAWQLKYCLDNDTDRFAWTDTTNGKGVVYWMKDEFDNEAPYDFKNIVNVRWKTNVVTQSNVKYLDVINLEQYFGPDYYDVSYLMAKAKAQYELIRNMSANNIQNVPAYLYTLGIDGAYVRVGDLADEDETFYNFLTDGDYYSLDDDDYIVAICYDDNEGVNTCYMVVDTSEEYELYTFVNGTIDSSSGAISDIVDSSLRLNNENVYENSLGVTYNGTALKLSENVFIGNGCYSNTFGNSCYSNTFGNDCYSNTFGNGCYSNTFGNDCSYNRIGDEVNNNEFEGYARWNIFENGVQYVSLEGDGSSGSWNNQIQNVTIHQGIKGASSSNMRTITINRNLAYSTDVYAHNSVSVTLDD